MWVLRGLSRPGWGLHLVQFWGALVDTPRPFSHSWPSGPLRCQAFPLTLPQLMRPSAGVPVLAALLEQTFLNSQLAGGPQQPQLTLNLGPFSPRRPYVRSKGRKFERARGRRASRGYKN